MGGLTLVAEEREPPLQDRAGPVADKQGWVNLKGLAGAFAPGASSKRQVVRKNPGVQRGEVDLAVGAGETAGKEPLGGAGMRGVRVAAKTEGVFRKMEAVLDGLDNSGPSAHLNSQAVTNDIDGMNRAGVKGRSIFLQSGKLAIDDHLPVAVFFELVKYGPEGSAAITNNRSAEQSPGALAGSEQLRGDLLGALGVNDPGAARAMRRSEAGIKKTKMVVDLRHCSNGRSWVPLDGALLNRDRGREPFYAVNCGPVDSPQESSGISGEGFEKSPVPLLVDRIEGEAGFP